MTLDLDAIVFAIGCCVFVYLAIRRLVRGSTTAKDAERMGSRATMLRTAATSFVPVALFVVAALRADYAFAWIALAFVYGLFGLLGLVVATVAKRQLDKRDEVVREQVSEEDRKKLVAQQQASGRLLAVVPLAVLGLWVAAWWRPVFGA